MHYEYAAHQQFSANTISGTVTADGAVVAGKMVQIHYASWGTRAITDAMGRFSLQAYGPDIFLRVGDDDDENGFLDFGEDWPKEWKVEDISGNVDVSVDF